MDPLSSPNPIIKTRTFVKRNISQLVMLENSEGNLDKKGFLIYYFDRPYRAGKTQANILGQKRSARNETA
jgi:hypothetical protein